MGKASREFQIFAKPAGAVCNLDCQYCYYRDKSSLYPDGGTRSMTEVLLEEYVVQHIEAASGPDIDFSWHGGEPTTLGVGFFQKAVELQPDFTKAHFCLGYVLLQNGQLDKAGIHFQRALELQPNFAEAHYSLGYIFLQQQQLDKAMSHFQKSLALQPDDPIARYYLGVVFCAERGMGRGHRPVS